MFNSKLKIVTSTLALSAVLAGCSATPGIKLSNQATKLGARSTGSWAMETFFALDNDLDNGSGVVSLLQAAASRGTSVTAATLYDGKQDNDCFYSYQTAPGSATQTLKKGEIDTGTPAALDDFHSFAMQNTPGARRVLTLSDHGGGIVRGICTDWTGPGGKKIIHVPQVAGVLQKNPVEIMMFDACFMNMMEVAYELRQVAKIVIGAQTTTIGDYPYESMVKIFDDNASADSAGVAKKLLSAIADNALYQVAFGVVDTAKSVEVATRLRKLSDLILVKANDPTMKKSLRDAIRKSQGYTNQRRPDLLMYNNYRDMVDVMDNIAKIDDPELREAAEAVAEATKASILAERHRGGFFPFSGFKLERVAGVSLYAQVDGPVEMNYTTRAWNKDTRWGDALVLINSTGRVPAIQQDKYPLAFPSRRLPQ